MANDTFKASSTAEQLDPIAGLQESIRPTSISASYVSHDLKYSAEFEDEMMRTVLSRVSDNLGTGVAPGNGNDMVTAGKSMRTEDVDPSSLPAVAEDELPLALDDARRVFESAVPGVKLTHPGGYLEGGPGLDAEMDTFPDDFLSLHGTSLSSPDDLRAMVEKEMQTNIGLLKERMEARRQAKEKNDQIERDLKVLTDQHSMELRIQSRMAEERRKKKEARERKREGERGEEKGG